MKLLFMTLLFTMFCFTSEDIAISFNGNKIIKTNDIQEALGVKTSSFLQFWKDKNATLASKVSDQLDPSLKLFYKNEGFYDANISQIITDNKIDIFIKENQPIIISKIDVQSDIDIDSEIEMKLGERFRSTDFGILKENVKKVLAKNGYCSAQKDIKSYIDKEKRVANIVIKIKKGDICKIGKITINGNEEVSQSTISSRLRFEEGDVFDVEKIKDSYNALYALEAFDEISIDHSRNFYNEVPIDIKVHELDKKIFTRVGLGYATDLKFQAKYHWEQKNYQGDGRKISFDALYSEKHKKIEASLSNPNLVEIKGYHLDVANTVGYVEERDIHDYDQKTFYNKFYISHQEDKWYHSVGIGVESTDISTDRQYFILYPFMRLVYDRRDSRINPKEGVYFSHDMEYGLPYSPDSTNYLKYLEELRLIYTVDEVTMAAVGRMGGINIFDNSIPESKKFFAGGAFSNRAYGYDKIGITQSSTTDSTDGGYNLANLSLEAEFPLYGNLRGAIFNDNTMINDNDHIWEYNNNVISSIGFGFRYMTPIAPFKIDFGVNVKDSKENGVHFQVGQSF